jgi:uncharacterized protein
MFKRGDSCKQESVRQSMEEGWAFRETHIAIRFGCEWHDGSGHWFHSYGNETGNSTNMA